MASRASDGLAETSDDAVFSPSQTVSTFLEGGTKPPAFSVKDDWQQ